MENNNICPNCWGYQEYDEGNLERLTNDIENYNK